MRHWNITNMATGNLCMSLKTFTTGQSLFRMHGKDFAGQGEPLLAALLLR